MKHLTQIVALLILPLIGFSQTKVFTLQDWADDHNAPMTSNITVLYPADQCPIQDVFFDQAPDNSNSAVSDVDCPTCPTGNMGPSQILADNFMIDVAQNITDICWSGEFIDAMGADCLPTSPSFSIVYYSDANPTIAPTIPGTEFARFDNVAPTVQASGNTLMGVNQYVFSTTHAPVSLEAGTTYWVSIYVNITGDCDFFWDQSATPPADFIGSVAFDAGNLSWTVSATDLAVSIGGIAAPIPTLGQWGIITLSLLMLIIGIVKVKEIKVSTVKIRK